MTKIVILTFFSFLIILSLFIFLPLISLLLRLTPLPLLIMLCLLFLLLSLQSSTYTNCNDLQHLNTISYTATLWSVVCTFDTIGIQAFYDRGPHRLFWTSSRAACGQMTISGIPYCLNYCDIFILYTKFTNVIADRVIQLGGPHAVCESEVGNPCSTTPALFT